MSRGRIVTDLCVIGAGAGGLSVAAGAVQLGARVVLIEAGEMGGDCLNTGCVPSKALLAAAARAAAMGGGLGVAPARAEVDFAAVKDHVAATIAAIAPHDSEERFTRLGVQVIRASARFVSPREVEAGGLRIAARRFVIATGSRPAIPEIPGLEGLPYLTTETIFALRERPEHLVILGAGPVGAEMAQAHRRLGAAVTLVEAAALLPREDPEAVAVLRARLLAEGVTLLEGARVAAAGAGASGGIALRLEDGRRIEGSHLLLATGRRPALEALDLPAAGIRADARGVLVDRGLCSTNRRVFAIGDAAGGPMFTHVAAYHAGLVVRAAVLGLPVRLRSDHLPRVTYTDPELAQIGPTEAEARARHGARLEVLRVPFAANDRALAEGRPEGFLKLMVRRGRLLGATVVGAGAGEIAAPLALAVSARLGLAALAGAVLPYPTRAEVTKRAAGAYFSARLFDNPSLRRVVGLIQRWLP